MTIATKSYLEVSYDLRPAKQVERRMFIDVLMKLSIAGFPIADYQYTGMGSIYFVDHILLHRYLGISKLLSVEHDLSIEKRVNFNKPFRHVNIEMKPIGEIIPDLDRDLKHILWLDYDDRIHADIISDVVLASHRLSPGSLLIITVDVEPPVYGDGPRDWMEYYRERAGDYFELGWKVNDFSRSRLPERSAAILFNSIRRGLAGRSNTSFSNLFKFVYADGHRMLTIGGMITTDSEKNMLSGAGLRSIPFVRLDLETAPFVIRVPKLTRKERLCLDSHMPCDNGWLPDDFELDQGYVNDYRDIYRFYPVFAELLL
jgi:hypothetical protein